MRGSAVHGRYVLYWMRSAVRAHENPALDVALGTAAALHLPGFVLQSLGEGGPFASDRHHRFALEGARDVAAELARRGIGHALHLERRRHRGPALGPLAADAALVVTEDMPTPSARAELASLLHETDAPVWAVDTACVVPFRLLGRPFTRAFAFREATEGERRARLGRPWIDLAPSGAPFLPSLPFDPVDLARADLAALVAECRIDHGIAPVPHTPGGSQAGYARWTRFREEGLGAYARLRNDALAGGVSRMSPYLHTGHVSPFRIAREAASVRTRGAEKFLDELLVWRELAHAFCAFTPDPGAVEALPGWALETLRAHATDPRPALLSQETLVRGRSGDALWDAAQASLVMHGELHNNVRMTWGKAVPVWTASPEAALDLLVDLNHRFALDGDDPASYGGLLWCLGQFDRPFPPERPILGTVRPRPTAEHASRLDVEAYGRRTRSPARRSPPRVAVIGAGIAGLTCARTLQDAGWTVRVLDKGSRPGGRVCTRMMDGESFDHGAQYLTARDPRFRRFVESWVHDGHVARWDGRIASLEGGVARVKSKGGPERFVGTPSMEQIARHLAAELDIRLERQVLPPVRVGDGWELRTENERLGRFEALVVAVPAPQAAALLAGTPALAHEVSTFQMEPTWAAMLGFPEPLPLGFDGAFVQRGPLAWVAREGSKPGRAPGDRWVLHATAEWSRAHLEAPRDEVARLLVEAFSAAVGGSLATPLRAVAHRWRFARGGADGDGPECLAEPDQGVVACGDWCLGGRIEGAFLSGRAAAGRLLGSGPEEAPEPPGTPVQQSLLWGA